MNKKKVQSSPQYLFNIVPGKSKIHLCHQREKVSHYLFQVATGCDSSVIALWDIETGNKSVVFSNAHGDEEITCMAFDSTFRRLFTGARNGSVKVYCLSSIFIAIYLSLISELDLLKQCAKRRKC